MLNSARAKIELAPKPATLAALLAILLLAALLSSWVVAGGERERTVTLHTPRHTYRLEVADTQAEREKGLGGRQSLPAREGMLFVFDIEERQCFWMKDVHFPIDIIWLDSKKRVMQVEYNLSPDTYPQTFCPTEPSSYVIELVAGQVQAAGIQQGSILRF